MFYFFLYWAYFITFILVCHCIFLIYIFLLERFFRKSDILRYQKIDKPIDIFIPGHNEWKILVDTIDSIVMQSYEYRKNIKIFFYDENDSSIVFFKKYSENHNLVDYNIWNNTYLSIFYIWKNKKADKLNSFLEKIHSPYIAFLDSDHIANKEWIEKWLSKLEQQKDDIIWVQFKKWPKFLQNIFSLNDSCQNHICHEAFNKSLDSIYWFVFFTGSTAIFKSESFKNYTFSESITEDTDMSYDFLLKWKKVIYDEYCWSQEENSMELGSYISRRRRWSNWHNAVFFKNFFKIWISNSINLQEKILLYFHASFFFMPILWLALINIIQFYIFFQYEYIFQIILFITISLCSIIIPLILKKKSYKLFIVECITTFLIIAPLFILIFQSILIISNLDIHHFIIWFPYTNYWYHYILFFLFLFPLGIILFSFTKVKLFNKKQKIIQFFSYFLISFVNVYSTTLWFFDFVLRNDVWNKISRKRKSMIILTKYTIIVFSTLTIMFMLFFPVKNNCNEYTYFYKKILETNNGLEFLIEKDISKNEKNLEIHLNIKILDDNLKSRKYYVFIDWNTETINFDNNNNYQKILVTNFWFEEKEVSILDKEYQCIKKMNFSNSIIQTKNWKIYLNNEEFFVKWIIPSFRPKNKESLYREVEKLKLIGVNLVRFYNDVSTDYINILKENNLLFIVQTLDSNWVSEDLTIPYLTNNIFNSYINLEEKYAENPFLFWINIWNELELVNFDLVKRIKSIISDIQKTKKSTQSIYTTYSTNINYETDILWFNMLDSGKAYWEEYINIIKEYQKPFLATELWWFVAFSEVIDPRIRSYRLQNQFSNLLKNWSSGIIIFESHDNWAQPVPPWYYNNPFEPEQPDDMRGLWTHDNKEKFILNTVRDLFWDIEISFTDTPNLENGEIILKLKNKRGYTLHDIEFSYDNKVFKSLFDLDKNEEKQAIFHLNENREWSDKIFLKYSTHSWLKNIQEIDIKNLISNKPFFLKKSSLFILEDNEERIRWEILSDDFDFLIPKWWSMISWNTTLWEWYHEIKNNDVFINPSQIDIVEKNGKKIKFHENEIINGDYSIDMYFKEVIKPRSKLVLEWIWAESINIRFNDGKLHDIKIPTRIIYSPYREFIVDLDTYINKDFQWKINISFSRNGNFVKFKTPKIFQPKEIVFEKNK